MDQEWQETPLTPGQRAEKVTADEAVHALPTKPYLGLTLRKAEARAAAEGRTLVVTDLSRGRPVLVWRRIRVELDKDGRVGEVQAG